MYVFKGNFRRPLIDPLVLSQTITSLGVIYPIVILCLKLSISLLYLRLFGLHKTFKYLVYLGIGFCSIFYIAYDGAQIATTVQCTTAQQMTRSICRNAHVLVVMSGTVNVVTDFYLLALPIPLVIQLQLKQRRKWGILAIFMTGLM